MGPKPKRRAERRDETRRRLLEATIACMGNVGYFDTTTTMIAARAKVSRGALQHHFRTRDDLFLAVTEKVGQELAAAFTPDLRADMPVEERVERICGTYWQVYHSDAYIAQVQIWIGARNDDPLQRRIEALTRRLLKAQNRLWQASFADLAVSPGLLSALRSLTLSAIRGLAMRPAYRIGARGWPREILILSRIVAQALRDSPAADLKHAAAAARAATVRSRENGA